MSRPDVAWRALADARRALVAWAVCVALLALVLVSVYPAVRDQAADLTKLLDSYPDAMKAFFGLSGVDYSTGAGYLQSEVFGLTGPLLLLVLAVGRGASAIAGEEERGTLDLLLATPVSRTRVVLEKAAAGALQVAAIGAVLWLALAGGATAFGLGIGLWRLAAAVLLTVLVAEVFGAVALAVRVLPRGAPAVRRAHGPRAGRAGPARRRRAGRRGDVVPAQGRQERVR